ncbi:MAG TPA: long-chain fatty acid--CoA ligase [Pyrinomonadaceae bacterium]|jgi:long-chain acyl-CoA synthetase
MADNVRQLVESRVAEYGDKPFLFSEADGREWSYTEFDRAVNRTANMLLSHRIAKGDAVSLLMPNSAEYIIAYFACWKIGALGGPVNSLLKPEEIEWVVGNSESKLMLIGGQFWETIEAIKKPPTILFDDIESAAGEFADALDPVELTSSDDAIIIYTSGTTGKPKGCLLTHGNLIANAQQIAEWMGFGPDDRLLTLMPLFHMNAVSVTTMTALYAGGSTVVSPKFSASRFWDIIAKYKVTSFGSVATMLSMLLASDQLLAVGGKPETGERDRSSLRFAMCGSAPVPGEVLRRFEETFDCLVIEGYGLSESTCRSTFNPPTTERRPGSCGMPIGNEMAVFDENDEPVEDGELGEIVLRGPNICKAYFKNADATAKAFANGWFHTGDIGYRDADGFFYIADRKSDMIIRGGENIYPREIDDLLYTHPAVAAAAVIGVPDELYGEEVAAFIVLESGEKTTADEVIAFCREHLADYKCPKTVHFLDEIPKGPTGKLLKRELAKMYRSMTAAG